MISGCSSPTPEQNITNETAPPPPPAKAPIISITSPSQGEVVLSPEETSDVTLSISTQYLTLKAPGGAAKAGEGHFRIIIDGGSPQTLSNKNYLMSGLALGEHTVSVELLNNDRSPYSPSVKKTVTFTVEKEPPAVYVPQEYTVSIKDFSYDPSSLSGKVSDKVTFVNTGAYPRSATCFIEGKQVFDTAILATGKSATIIVDSEYECEYYSTTFRAMTGFLKVESNGMEEG
ncbi:MAG: hypothetical protein V1827_06130 [Candidatus Micrarchaeota archaeon]